MLDNLGPFLLEYWDHVQEIHCIFPNTEEGQAYIVRQADYCHYQGEFDHFIQGLQSFNGVVEMKIYHPQRNYASDFLVLLNKTMSTQPFLSRVDWMSVSVLRHAERKKSASTKPGRFSILVSHHQYVPPIEIQ